MGLISDVYRLSTLCASCRGLSVSAKTEQCIKQVLGVDAQATKNITPKLSHCLLHPARIGQWTRARPEAVGAGGCPECHMTYEMSHVTRGSRCLLGGSARCEVHDWCCRCIGYWLLASASGTGTGTGTGTAYAHDIRYKSHI
jgi:hypothetical protein